MLKDQTVTLARPATVHDVMRYPVEGSLTVSADEAKRLKLAGVLVDDGNAPAKADSDALVDKKLEDLMILVTKEGVPLHGVTKKADVVAAIERHRTYKADGLKELDLATASKDQLLVIAVHEAADVPEGDKASEDDLRKAITDHRSKAAS